MSTRRVVQICTVSYLSLYLVAMVLPRRLFFDWDYPQHTNLFKKVVRKFLYYNGPLEPVANFLFLMPIFVILLQFLGRSKAIYAVAICIALSAGAEIFQKFIPGRVSSIRDFTLNSAGVISTFIFYKFYTRINRSL